MKNLFRFLLVASLSVLLFSCNTDEKESTATYYLTADFELPDEDYLSSFVDSLAYLPFFYYEQIAYMTSNCSELNQGYLGGFKLSHRFGSINDPDDLATFSSAGNDQGGALSKTYAAYFDTGFAPEYDFVFDLTPFSEAYNQVIGCHINNTKYTERLFQTGALENGDYLKVVAYFYSRGMEVGNAEKYLVDYRDGKTVFVRNWENWTMGETFSGSFDSVRFRVVVSSPKFRPCFCIDTFMTYLEVTY